MGGRGSGGQNRKTDEEKRLNGTLRKDRSNPDAPKVERASDPRPPKYFNEQQRAAFRAVFKCTEPLGSLGVSDLLMVEMAALALAQVRQVATAEVVEQKLLKDCIKTASDCLAKLGLTSQSRATVTRIAGPEVVDELDEFLRPPEAEDFLQ